MLFTFDMIRPGAFPDRRRASAAPPEPGLLTSIRNLYDRRIADGDIGGNHCFEEFTKAYTSAIRGDGDAAAQLGLDNGTIRRLSAVSSDRGRLIRHPEHRLKGVLKALVLLVDFPDHPAGPDSRQPDFQRAFFGDASGDDSVRAYFRRISGWTEDPLTRGVDLNGEVHGWFRMPRNRSSYAGEKGFLNAAGYPANAQALACDAMAAAIEAGVDLSGFDNYGDGEVTAPLIVFAGEGAERTGAKDDFWSHKWNVADAPRDPVTGLGFNAYAAIPEICSTGVRAHEIGHLAGQWGDYYDTARDAAASRGLGDFCLMASGCWGDGGARPVLPNCLLRMMHDWIDVRPVVENTNGFVDLHPAAGPDANAIQIWNPARMPYQQYILCEYRSRISDDAALPDQGVAVYAVDETAEGMNDENQLAVELIQADGRRELSIPGDGGNAGDGDDLFPFRGGLELSEATHPSLRRKGGLWSGVTIEIAGRPGDPTMGVRVSMKN